MPAHVIWLHTSTLTRRRPQLAERRARPTHHHGRTHADTVIILPVSLSGQLCKWPALCLCVESIFHGLPWEAWEPLTQLFLTRLTQKILKHFKNIEESSATASAMPNRVSVPRLDVFISLVVMLCWDNGPTGKGGHVEFPIWGEPIL